MDIVAIYRSVKYVESILVSTIASIHELGDYGSTLFSIGPTLRFLPYISTEDSKNLK